MKAQKLISNGVLSDAWMFYTRGSFLWEETGTPWENPHVRVGDQPYPLIYNHCRSRGSNSGRIGEKPVHYHCATRTPNFWKIQEQSVKDLNRGYSMHFDEYGIYFTSETGFLIFSRVRSTSENIIKILSHEWNKFHIHQKSIEFSVYYIFFAFEHVYFKIERFESVTQHNVIIKNMTSQSALLFSLWK
jgi:hypothetical protein